MKNENSQKIHQNILWNELISICEEQANNLLKAAFGPIVREAGDISAGVFDDKYNMLAQAITGTPGHVNTMAKSVQAMISEVPKNSFSEGDVLITNDPWLGAGHIFDFVAVTPVFHKKILVAYFASTCHITDIGGIGWSAEARSMFEEGTLIPVSFLRKNFEVQEQLLNIICSNSRVSNEARGDILSLMSSNDTGVERLLKLFKKYKLPNLTSIAKFIFASSNNAMMSILRQLPKGVFENKLNLDGYDQSIFLTAKVSITSKHIEVDLNGSSEAINRGINCPLNYSIAYASYGIKVAIFPDIPNNAASLETIKVKALPGLIVSAQKPSPVTSRHVIGHALPDLVLGCLAIALPNKIISESSGALWTISLTGEDRIKFSSLNVALGGMGARPNSDGLSTTAFPSGVGAVSVEVSENAAPVIYHKKELIPNSGGKGKFRGGLGQEIVIGALTNEPYFISAAAFERTREGPNGREGGERGSKGSVTISDGRIVKDKGNYMIKANDTVCLRTPGGGGFGKFNQRKNEKKITDLKFGYITKSNL